MRPIPRWTNENLPGIKSARESVVDGSIHLSITEAVEPQAVADGYSIVYFIYGGPTEESVELLFFTDQLEIDIPIQLAGSNWLWKATASITLLFYNNQIEVLSTIIYDPAADKYRNLQEITPGLYLYPSSLITANDTFHIVNSADFFPIAGDFLYEGSLGYYYAGSILFLNEIPPHIVFPIEPIDFPVGTANVYFETDMSISLHPGVEISGSLVRALPNCGLPSPKWIDQRHIGLEKVEDVGDGYSVILSWDYATPPDGFSTIYYNIYRSNSAYSLYRDPPFAIANSSPVQFESSRPDIGMYYGVRAVYFLADFTTTGMIQSQGLILYPQNTVLTAPFIFQDTSVSVESTAGYPDSGFFVIGKRICRYLSKTNTTFDDIQQDIFVSNDEADYPAGSIVSLFVGIEEKNPYFWRMTTSWNTSGVAALPVQIGDGYFGNLYLQDDDGYRNIHESDLIENHDIVDNDAEEAGPYDFCGLRNNDPAQFTSGQYCAPNTVHGTGTYHGNSARGEAGGINVFEGNLARQELLLSVTGEPFILLRRKWTGKTCPRTSHRNEHPDGRCSLCYSTSFEGGYDRFINLRQIRSSELNPNGFILMRVSPYSDELAINDTRGFTLERTDLNAWLPAVPTIRDRDILIRYYFDFETAIYREEFRYEVVSVTRNKINLGKDGAQQITMKRINVTDEIYKFPVNLI